MRNTIVYCGHVDGPVTQVNRPQVVVTDNKGRGKTCLMAPPTLIELVLCVQDVRKAARFYREVVGLEPIKEPSDGWASFWAGEKETNAWIGLRKGTLLYEEHSPFPEGERFGRVHYAMRVPTEQRELVLARLESNGVEVYGPEVWEPGRFEGASYYFYDPDGNLLEFWFPAEGT